MNRFSPLGVALCATVLSTVSHAATPQGCNAPVNRCDPGCYDLSNKINGQVSTPDYGLRLDGLFGAPTDHWTFDFEDPQLGVEMCYDGAGTITIHGTAFGGHDIGSAWDPNTTGLIEIHFTYENAICGGANNDELIVDIYQGGVGYGTVKWLNTNEVIHLSGKPDSQGRLFIFDQNSNAPARGWVQYHNGYQVGDFAMTIGANNDCPPPADCDGDGLPDSAEADCDANGVPDDCEPSEDCDGNGVPDRCDLNNGGVDLDGNGVLDRCEPGVITFCTGEDSVAGNFPCPCGNEVVPGATEGCANSSGVGASLATAGSTSIAAGDLVLLVTQIPGTPPGYFFGGTAPAFAGQGAPFGNGIRCIGGQLVRLGKVPMSVGGQASFPPQGAPPVHVLMNASPGDVSYLQFWYRDPGGPCGASANMSNGVAVTWAP